MYVLIDDWCKQWSDPFAELARIDGQVFRELEGRKTFRFERGGKGYFAKLHWGVGWKEIVKNLLQGRLPVVSAKNEWRAIQRFSQLGVSTMRLVGYGCSGLNPAQLKSFVLTEELAPIISLQDFCQDWKILPPTFALKQAILTKVAHIARQLHEHGVNHRDFYICHFLLDLKMGLDNLDANNVLIYLIDLHRVQLRRYTPQRWRVKDISGLYFSAMDLGLTKRDLFRFAKIYHQQPLRDTLQKNKLFWWRVQRRARLLYFKTHHKLPEES